MTEAASTLQNVFLPCHVPKATAEKLRWCFSLRGGGPMRLRGLGSLHNASEHHIP